VGGFLEKPGDDEDVRDFVIQREWLSGAAPTDGRDYLASMGIYLFKRDVLVKALMVDYQDFGRDIFPAIVRSHHVQAHFFDDYWEDIGTIRAFYEANLALADPNPPFDLGKPDAPVYSRARFLPPARLDGATVRRSLVAEGCHIGHGATIENSVIGLRCVIGNNVTIKDSIIMGADFYETAGQLTDGHNGRPPLGIGEGSVIGGAIIDKNCRIGRNVIISNEEKLVERNVDGFCVIQDGIPVIVKGAILPDGWSLSSAAASR
jgi:glucose-1-phosphate adenylyltransferase